jgi:ribosomal protein S18 acetylase RimI-like enzyme
MSAGSEALRAIQWRGNRSVFARAYAEEDRDGCLGVFDSNVPRFFRVAERAEFAAFLRAPPGPYAVFVADKTEVLACGGYAIRAEDGIASLCWGMVRADLHGCGLGGALARLRLEAVRHDPRVRHIVLNTSQHTVGFYERLGFRVTTVEKDGYAPGLDRCEMSADDAGGSR